MIIGVVEKSPPEKQVVFRFHDLPFLEGDLIPRVYKQCIYIYIYESDEQTNRWTNQQRTTFQHKQSLKNRSVIQSLLLVFFSDEALRFNVA